MYACNLEAMCTTLLERTSTHAWVTYAQAWVHAETCAGLLMDMESFKSVNALVVCLLAVKCVVSSSSFFNCFVGHRSCMAAFVGHKLRIVLVVARSWLERQYL